MTDQDVITEAGKSVKAERYVPYYLSLLNNRLSWGGSQLYLKLFDIGLNEWRILSALRNEPGIQALRICEMITLNKSVVSRSTRRLEEMKLVEARLEQGKRLLWLLPRGAELHDQIIEIAYRRQDALLDGFDQKDLDTLYGLLERMRQNLKKVDKVDNELLQR
ncbi:MarR family winged helix-turn-helix transcriptional regulator [Aquamicrobium zhengzhouense]|uniref:Winged helix-turn-helix transcriptional regulator n=1 Tax=Aquamicrobium zhengzhouense TaxID=2781738 RepID=A0ABS0SHV7_9HYPH|nr:MarR family winged helix-turn-helix transcriptional regulator [Aquamicrobium zhengzhouense]MBI1622028.1 winged helix-turn-helix transcriptional regulator [Aquamicrobium zhengzhouense]